MTDMCYGAVKGNKVLLININKSTNYKLHCKPHIILTIILIIAWIVNPVLTFDNKITFINL